MIRTHILRSILIAALLSTVCNLAGMAQSGTPGSVQPNSGATGNASLPATGAQAFRISPVRPMAELRAEAMKATPPQEAGQFDAPQLVELIDFDSSIHLEIRYATGDNFLGEPVYEQARAFLQKPAAEALRRASEKLHEVGYGLLVYDAYRPWYVTKIFWDAVPVDKREFVADPAQGSNHNRGCAVDLTLYHLETGAAVNMPSGYDEMSPRAYSDYGGASPEQREYRAILRDVMKSEGFAQRPNEWWHFDYKDCQRYGILNLPFDRIPAFERIPVSTYRIGGDVLPPKILERKEPEYSDAARGQHIEGTVILSIVVDVDGMPTDIHLEQRLGYGLDEQAIRAVQQWRFKPATKEGVAVPVQVRVEVSFRLYNKKHAPWN